jgi:pyruvate formate lyase activating enzyme
MQTGLVFNIQKYALQDGPGVRTTVFLKGCPLRCWWCHNPEGLSPEPEILVAEGRCTGCGKCQDVCPQSKAAGKDRGGRIAIDAGACLRCGACVAACPTQARQLVGRRMTVEEVLAEVWKDCIFYGDIGGGVTFSGGEPFQQSPFLLELLQACRQRELHTAVDTSGCTPQDELLAAAAWTDLFLYDLKMFDDVRHRQYTGISNVPILENLKALGQVHRCIWVRVPVLPGVNDEVRDLEALVEFVASVPGVRQVHLLPYHQTALHKITRSGKRHRLEMGMPSVADFLGRAVARLKTFGLPIFAGGHE